MKASKKTAPKNVEELFLTKNKRLLDPFSVIPLIPIQPDHLVGDIGCGSGNFSIPLAKYLFSGTLYAFDKDVAMLLLKEKLVSVVHGEAFGLSPYFRLSYATSLDNIKEAVERISKSLS